MARDVHHRLGVKAGGRHGAARQLHDRLSNLMHVCRPCHRWVTDHPRMSYVSGWSLREGDDPAVEPVFIRDRPVYLDDAGVAHPYLAAVYR